MCDDKLQMTLGSVLNGVSLNITLYPIAGRCSVGRHKKKSTWISQDKVGKAGFSPQPGGAESEVQGSLRANLFKPAILLCLICPLSNPNTAQMEAEFKSWIP